MRTHEHCNKSAICLTFCQDSSSLTKNERKVPKAQVLNVWVGLCLACKGYHIYGSVQERHNSVALAMEFHLSCTNTSIWYGISSKKIICLLSMINATVMMNNLCTPRSRIYRWVSARETPVHQQWSCIFLALTHRYNHRSSWFVLPRLWTCLSHTTIKYLTRHQYLSKDQINAHHEIREKYNVHQ